jgi:hypothetical protein
MGSGGCTRFRGQRGFANVSDGANAPSGPGADPAPLAGTTIKARKSDPRQGHPIPPKSAIAAQPHAGCRHAQTVLTSPPQKG